MTAQSEHETTIAIDYEAKMAHYYTTRIGVCNRAIKRLEGLQVSREGHGWKFSIPLCHIRSAESLIKAGRSGASDSLEE